MNKVFSKEDEHPKECTELINEIIDYLEYDWKGLM